MIWIDYVVFIYWIIVFLDCDYWYEWEDSAIDRSPCQDSSIRCTFQKCFVSGHLVPHIISVMDNCLLYIFTAPILYIVNYNKIYKKKTSALVL